MRFPSFATGHVILICQSMLLAVALLWIWKGDKEVQHIETAAPSGVADAAPPSVVTTTEQSINMPHSSPEKTHDAIIKQIEDDAGMFLSRVAQLIIKEEGVKARPYLDSGGQVTIGIGRNLTGNGVSVAELQAIVEKVDYQHILSHASVRNGRVYIHSLEAAERVFPQPLTKYDITMLLTDDLNNVRKEAEQVFGASWESIDLVRREVIVNVLYNLGLTRFRQFKKFIAAVKAGKWHESATELLLSEAARENITRYHRDATVLQTGDERYFNLQ